MSLKEAYQEKAEAQLREWQTWIDQYKADPMPAILAARGDRQRISERLEDYHRVARIRLKELGAAQDDRWELSKQAVERAMIELKHVLDESGAGLAARYVPLETSRPQVFEVLQKRG